MARLIVELLELLESPRDGGLIDGGLEGGAGGGQCVQHGDRCVE